MTSEDRVQREEIMRRAVLSGDERSWKLWYASSFESLDAYILWRCQGLRDRADEIAQETWLIAVRQIRRFDPHRGSFLDWLRGIAANVVRGQLRKERQRRDKDQARARGISPETRKIRGEADDRVSMALDAQATRHEAVLRAKYLEGLSVSEIATLWNESLKAVESLLTRARAEFRRIYEKQTEMDGAIPPDGGVRATDPISGTDRGHVHETSG